MQWISGRALVIASEAKQSISRLAQAWIASSQGLLAMTEAGMLHGGQVGLRAAR
jgi:hypothetical protein